MARYLAGRAWRWLLPLTAGLVIRGATPALLSVATQRLIDLAKLYVTVEYFDPAALHSGKDWNAAFVRALPELRAAKDDSTLQAAAVRLMAELEGPAGSAPATGDWFRLRFHHGLATPGTEFYTGYLLRRLRAQPTVTINIGAARVAIQTAEPNTALEQDSLREVGTAERLSSTAFPSEEERILGAFRLWGAVRYFFAHKDSLDEDWDGLLAEFLPKLIEARDARAYQLLIAEWVSHLSDSMAGVESPELTAYFGKAAPDTSVRLLEKKPIVTRVGADAARAGLHAGDLLVRVDGENVVERIKREANYLSAATPASLSELVAKRLLNGPEGSMVELAYVRGGASPVTIKVPRRSEPDIFAQANALPVNTPYINLVGAAKMPELPGRARAVIFDLRGDSAVNGAELASRLEGSAGSPAYLVTAPIAVAPDVAQPGLDTSTASDFQLRSVPRALNQLSTQVVVLMDARTRGNAERTALMLLAGGKARSIGGTTAGSAGEVAHVMLPGEVDVHFSGADVRLLNGAPLQRQGISPYLPVSVTQAGVRAGRDEVLEAALRAVAPK